MDNLLLKYNKLDQLSQQLVDDFIEMLVNRQQAIAKKGKKQTVKSLPEQVGSFQTLFDHQAYKKQLLSLPTWTSDDVKAFDENLALFKNMSLKEW